MITPQMIVAISGMIGSLLPQIVRIYENHDVSEENFVAALDRLELKLDKIKAERDKERIEQYNRKRAEMGLPPLNKDGSELEAEETAEVVNNGS